MEGLRSWEEVHSWLQELSRDEHVLVSLEAAASSLAGIPPDSKHYAQRVLAGIEDWLAGGPADGIHQAATAAYEAAAQLELPAGSVERDALRAASHAAFALDFHSAGRSPDKVMRAARDALSSALRAISLQGGGEPLESFIRDLMARCHERAAAAARPIQTEGLGAIDITK